MCLRIRLVHNCGKCQLPISRTDPRSSPAFIVVCNLAPNHLLATRQDPAIPEQLANAALPRCQYDEECRVTSWKSFCDNPRHDLETRKEWVRDSLRAMEQIGDLGLQAQLDWWMAWAGDIDRMRVENEAERETQAVERREGRRPDAMRELRGRILDVVRDEDRGPNTGGSERPATTASDALQETVAELRGDLESDEDGMSRLLGERAMRAWATTARDRSVSANVHRVDGGWDIDVMTEALDLRYVIDVLDAIARDLRRRLAGSP